MPAKPPHLDPVLVAQAFGPAFVRRPQSRYYFTRDRDSGKYRIIDRQLHRGMVIAEADFREAATAIVIALNEVTKPKAKPSEHTPPASLARPAVLADVLLPSQLNTQYLLSWIDGRFEPPPRC